MASELSISCVSPRVRGTLLEVINLVSDDAEMKAAAKELLDELPDCSKGQVVGFSISESLKRRRGKRAPSAYNLFIGNCMRGGQRTLKECAVNWKREKASTGNG